jgi:hypothetical protein
VVKKFDMLFTGISIFGMWGLIYAVLGDIYQMFPQTFAQQRKHFVFNGAYEKITAKIGFFFLSNILNSILQAYII